MWKVNFSAIHPAHITIYRSYRSSQRRCSVRKGVLRNFAQFIGKTPVPESFFNKVAWPAQVTRDSGTGVFLRILRNF